MLENTEGTIIKWTIQRNWQHWVHKNEDKQTQSIIPYTNKHKLDVLSNKQEERMCFFYLFPCADVKHDFHITWSSWLLTVIRRVSLVEPELLPLPENLCGHPCFSGVRVCSIFSFLHMCFFRSLFVLLSFRL